MTGAEFVFAFILWMFPTHDRYWYSINRAIVKRYTHALYYLEIGWLNPSKAINAYISQYIMPSLVLVVVCLLPGANPIIRTNAFLFESKWPRKNNPGNVSLASMCYDFYRQGLHDEVQLNKSDSLADFVLKCSERRQSVNNITVLKMDVYQSLSVLFSNMNRNGANG